MLVTELIVSHILEHSKASKSSVEMVGTAKIDAGCFSRERYVDRRVISSKLKEEEERGYFVRVGPTLSSRPNGIEKTAKDRRKLVDVWKNMGKHERRKQTEGTMVVGREV
ncbi:hypothetical protein QLX08_007848 [Tetragonisca angustula]|uniref:Uncharacterized protein n=1 Tax=Tetragonisca angustula TaxID=166442 RepID=A0AAW0ZMW8_9HYME